MNKFIAALALALALPASNVAGPATADLLVLVGVPASLHARVINTASMLLNERTGEHQLVEVDRIDAAEMATLTRSGERVIALGPAACKAAIDSLVPDDHSSTLTCALLSAEAFDSVDCTPACGDVSAIVMDQPIDRQRAVAQGIYPSLRDFGALSEASFGSDVSIDVQPFLPGAPLPEQLNEALAGNDALIALPESSIFNRSTLHVVLLTAYGHSKPVIGFSQAYVKAGALISAYSTPEQILRELLIDNDDVDPTVARVRPPAHFSIAENRRIARSLGLLRERDVDPMRDYADEDFPS